jgi:glycosyltransferase involved in cell wall biosynthesis
MKVLVVSNMYPSRRHPHYGIFVRRRVIAYEKLGVHVKVVSTGDPRKGFVRVAAKYARLLVDSVAAVLAFKPDVIEAHYLAPTGPIAALAGFLGRAPYVLYAHGSDVDVRMPAKRWAVRRAAEIHTNSTDTAERIKSRYSHRPEVVVVPPGVDTSVFYPVHTADPAQPGTIVFVGDLVHHKGVDVLLSALPMLETAAWRCLVAGDGLARSELEATAVRLQVSDRLTWLGRVAPDHVADVFRQGHVAVVPSRRDALGQVAVEALACGIPVVVSRVGGLPSVPDEDCGEVVPPDRPMELARAIDRWLARRGDRSVRAAALERAAGHSMENIARVAVDRLSLIAAGSRGTNAHAG